MNIRLLSGDKQLYKLCRETLAKLSRREWELFFGPAGEGDAEADLTLWDCDSDVQLPEELDLQQERRNIFILSRKKLTALRDRFPMAAVSILLKPVNRATLAAFLDHAMARHKAPPAGADVDSLRRDRDDILQCLLHANVKLQEYDQDRTNFLARAVHDFRAPLTAIEGYCGLMVSGQLGALSEDQKDVLQRMQHSARRLTRMAMAMFELSVGHQVERRPEFQEGDLAVLVQQAFHEIGPLADAKRINLSVNLAVPTEPLCFDTEQIEQVLVNLLENACKFTPKYGGIEVRGYPHFWERRGMTPANHGPAGGDRRSAVGREPNSYRIDIRDSGPGIPVDHLDRIFEEYTSYGGGQDRSGGGLGLAICKFILSLHQGHIWAEPGAQGAIFSFVLPLVRGRSEVVVAADGPSRVMRAGASLY